MKYKTIFIKFFLFVLLNAYNLGITNASIVVLNGLTHENQIQPGENYRGFIQIQNTAKTEKSVSVYSRDYWFSYTGESKHDPAGTLDRSNAEWITFTPELVTLAPNEITTINFEVNVPKNDTLRGTYWSVLMVEGIVPPDTTNHKKGVTINTAIRYAVQIITNIGNTGNSNMQFLGMQLTKQNDNNVLNVVVENTGERILRPEMNLELFDESGNSVAVFKSERRKTYPGTSIKVELIMEGIEPGKYNAVLVADCDEDNIFGTNLSLEIG